MLCTDRSLATISAKLMTNASARAGIRASGDQTRAWMRRSWLTNGEAVGKPAT